MRVTGGTMNIDGREVLHNGLICLVGAAVIAANATLHGGFEFWSYLLAMLLGAVGGGAVLLAIIIRTGPPDD